MRYNKWVSAANPRPPPTTTAATRENTNAGACLLRAAPCATRCRGPELTSRVVVWLVGADRRHCPSSGAPWVPDNGTSREVGGVAGSAGATTRTCAVDGSGSKTLRFCGSGAMTDLVPGGAGCWAARSGPGDDGRRALAGAAAALPGGSRRAAAACRTGASTSVATATRGGCDRRCLCRRVGQAVKALPLGLQQLG